MAIASLECHDAEIIAIGCPCGTIDATFRRSCLEILPSLPQELLQVGLDGFKSTSSR